VLADKGLARIAARTAQSLAADPLPLFDGGFDWPLLVLRESAIDGNIAAMAGYCARHQVLHAPHGKTTMAPQLFSRQLAAGAWAITAATIWQLQVYRASGVPRVLLASELADPHAVGWLGLQLAADPGFDCYVYADSAAGVRLLADGLRAVGSGAQGRLRVLVELGFPGGRSGCRSTEAAVAVAQAVLAEQGLRLAGVAGFEGGIRGPDPAATQAAIAAFAARLRELAESLPGQPPDDLPGFIVSAGGSAYFDIVLRELSNTTAPLTVLLRSGAYVIHDHGHYAATGPAGRGVPGTPRFAGAAELCAQVISVPEPGLALLNAGLRDISCDQGMPVPLWLHPAGAAADAAPASLAGAGYSVRRLDDQHGYLRLPDAAPVRPGDLVGLGCTHPCTTMDKWRMIPVVDDDYLVRDLISTFF
jgi:D-serine deaminase-like pyridoxal phosphate-dependent protein